jgi:hypothetical protein
MRNRRKALRKMLSVKSINVRLVSTQNGHSAAWAAARKTSAKESFAERKPGFEGEIVFILPFNSSL